MLVASCMTFGKAFSILNLDFFIYKMERMGVLTSQGCQTSEGTRASVCKQNVLCPQGSLREKLPIGDICLPYVVHIFK